MSHATTHRTHPARRGTFDLVVDGEHLQRVVQQGIAEAAVSLEIATADFKAMLLPENHTRRAPSVVRLLRDLAGRGVEVRLLHAGVPSAAALDELRGGLPEGLVIRRCPRLHSKLVIVDAAAMYIGSANLTGAGLGAKADGRRNFEMGIWTTDTRLIDRAQEQFNQLWEGRECPTCKRRDICPEPLEEPRL